MIGLLAFFVGAFMVASTGLALVVWRQWQQIAVLEDILATMADDRTVAQASSDMWGE